MSRNFTDQAHIEQIRKRLWCGREIGQAAVMIGSGFSRNAEKISPTIPSFPLWGDVAGLIYDSLYPSESTSNKARAISGNGVLKIASEYELQFSRQALDDLVQESIPDNDYRPGELHKLLLSLPWSDVFTTNYDTLLERTRPFIHERKYDLVLTSADVPGAMKPRIVKLHGSFPSTRPFILTEEDFRTYPKKFAPFVNMVQQSIMENRIFCLIGFSGDDPNFLHWSGWVRDNLGDATPPIYLCGILNLTDSQKRALEHRRVTPIDLSPIVAEWLDPNTRHEKALEWFLVNLLNGQPPNVIMWPIPRHRKRTVDQELPPIPPGPASLPDLGKKLPPSQYSLEAQDLNKICEAWKCTRQTYPGWVICPKENRNDLWDYTEFWVNPIFRSLDKISFPEKIFLLFELNWRLELTLTPLFDDWSNKIEEVIKVFNPFPKHIQIETATIKPDQSEYKELDWNLLRSHWVELVFALVRRARETQDQNRFQLWMGHLEKILRINKEWQMRWFYEYCLFHLFCFDVNGLHNKLNEWPDTKDFPFWQTKRASILAEFGELEEAKRLVEESLNTIRSRFKPFTIDYLLLSQEAWTMVLLKALTDNSFSNQTETIAEYRDRWETLSSYRCSPWYEIESLEAILEGPRPIATPKEKKKKSFDPGVVTTTQSLSSGLNIFYLRPAYKFLRLHEEAALPVKCGFVTANKTLKAAEWVNYLDTYLAVSMVIRTGDKEALEIWFNRVNVAVLPVEVFDRLKGILIKTLSQAIDILVTNKPGSGFSYRLVISHIELLSRFCIRFLPEDLEILFDVAIRIYKTPIFRYAFALYDYVSVLFKRLFQTMSYDKILEKIEVLLCLPMPSEGAFEVSHPQTWVEPMNCISWAKDTKVDNSFKRSSWTNPIKHLIQLVQIGAYEARWRSTVRLTKLIIINGLTEEEKKDFAVALWSKIDPMTNLPKETNLWNFNFLILPELETGKGKEIFRQSLLASGFRCVLQRTSTYTMIPIGGLQNLQFITEWRNSTYNLIDTAEEFRNMLIDWTPEDVIKLLDDATTWWDIEKGELQDRASSGIIDKESKLREQFSGLIPLMEIVIFPRLANANEEVKLLAKRLLDEMKENGFCVYSVLPVTLFFDKESYDEITKSIRFGLNSMEQEEVNRSITGLYNWIAYGTLGLISPPPPDLLNELINRVVTRRQPGLLFVIKQVTRIIKNFPTLLTKEHLNLLLLALGYLIKDTEYPRYDLLVRLENISTLIPIADIPEYRSAAAKLAYRLFTLQEMSVEPTHQILNHWKEICQNDPLPEVRQVWK